MCRYVRAVIVGPQVPDDIHLTVFRLFCFGYASFYGSRVLCGIRSLNKMDPYLFPKHACFLVLTIPSIHYLETSSTPEILHVHVYCRSAHSRFGVWKCPCDYNSRLFNGRWSACIGAVFTSTTDG